MSKCKDILNKFFIETKGYDPENRFNPSNESLYIYSHQQKRVDELEKERRDYREYVTSVQDKHDVLLKKLEKAVECIENLIPLIDAKGEDCQYHETGKHRYQRLDTLRASKQTLKELGEI